ncbi:MAG TPA: CvpA family protein [Candidatus Binatia bacterium]|nr:CvpA family protein [Candidatus Binatia bacterium]
MSDIDIGILVVLGLALITGWWRGLIGPVITWAFIVAGVVVGFGHPSVAARFAPSPGWRPFMGLVLVLAFGLAGILAARLVGRMFIRHIPVVGTLDRVGGALVSAVLALVAIFIVLSGMVTLDQAARPVVSAATVSAQEVSEVERLLPANPGTAILLDPAQLQALQQRLGSSTAPAAQLSQLNAPLGFLQSLHVQLVESRVAPVIFAILERIPFLGNGQSWPSS